MTIIALLRTHQTPHDALHDAFQLQMHAVRAVVRVQVRVRDRVCSCACVLFVPCCALLVKEGGAIYMLGGGAAPTGSRQFLF